MDNDEQEWPGWGEDDWDEDTVRADLMRLIGQLAAADDAPEPVVKTRLKRLRMWAAIERARGPQT